MRFVETNHNQFKFAVFFYATVSFLPALSESWK